MAIPADLIVRVHPIVLNPGGSSLVFNGLLLSKSNLIPVSIPSEVSPSIPGILQFASPLAVARYFGYTSDEYRFSQIYFKGYDNSSRKPSILYIGRRIDTDAPPWVMGLPVLRMSAFVGVTEGDFTVSFNGTPVTITPINASAATSFSEVASLLQSAIQAAGSEVPAAAGATVTYNSNNNAFILTGATAGEGQTISEISGELADVMGLSSSLIPTFSIGVSTETEAETMDRLNQTTSNWVSYSSIWEMTDDEVIAFANWHMQYDVRYFLVPWRLDPHAPVASDSADLVSVLESMGLEGVPCTYYEDFTLAAFIMGTTASINFRTIQGAITFAFKSQSGITPNVNDRETAVVLRDKGWNFYGNYATANDRFIFLYQGSMPGQRYRWLDTYVNAIWLNNELQLAGMLTLTTIPRIPYAEMGYTFIRAGLQGPINRAAGPRGNGVIDIGVTLSELQKAEVIREAGMDITPDLFMYGWFLIVRDPAPEDRAERLSPDIWLWYTYGGSVHRLEIASVAIT